MALSADSYTLRLKSIVNAEVSTTAETVEKVQILLFI